MRTFFAENYNLILVTSGVMLLGLSAGVVGTFLLMRRRSLVSDALSHATLPGIAVAFLVMVAAGGTGKALSGLLIGATLSCIVGVGCILAVRHYTRTKEDAALGIVLSVFFGIGVALLGIIQRMPTGNAAGLKSFIFGKTASMIASDAILIGVSSFIAIGICICLFKELAVLCFDQEFTGSQGYPVMWLDGLLMFLVIGVTVIGLQAVGLILVVALLVTPPAAARFWTERLPRMAAISAGIAKTRLPVDALTRSETSLLRCSCVSITTTSGAMGCTSFS